MRECGWLGHDAAAVPRGVPRALCRQRIHSRRKELDSLAWVFAKEEESARSRSGQLEALLTRTFSIGLDVGRGREKVALVRLRLSKALLGTAETQAMAAEALTIGGLLEVIETSGNSGVIWGRRVGA